MNSAGANPADNAASNPQDDGSADSSDGQEQDVPGDENLDEEDPSDSNQNPDPDLDPGPSADMPDEGNEPDPTDSQQEDENGLKRVIYWGQNGYGSTDANAANWERPLGKPAKAETTTLWSSALFPGTSIHAIPAICLE